MYTFPKNLIVATLAMAILSGCENSDDKNKQGEAAVQTAEKAPEKDVGTKTPSSVINENSIEPQDDKLRFIAHAAVFKALSGIATEENYVSDNSNGKGVRGEMKVKGCNPINFVLEPIDSVKRDQPFCEGYRIQSFCEENPDVDDTAVDLLGEWHVSCGAAPYRITKFSMGANRIHS